jgi:hypothetical protein
MEWSREDAMEVVREGTTSTPFLFKLWSMLEDPDYGHAISWNSEIRGFTVHDIDDLEDLLPNHFRSRQFSSFQRQLNYFSFRKVGKQGYVHPQFFRTHPEEVKDMRRKTNTGNMHKNRRAAAKRRKRKRTGDREKSTGDGDALQNSTIHNVQPQDLGRKRMRMSSRDDTTSVTARPKLFAAPHATTRKYINDPNLDAITPCTTSEFMTDLATYNWSAVKTPGTTPRGTNDPILTVAQLLRHKSIEFKAPMPSLLPSMLSPTTL